MAFAKTTIKTKNLQSALQAFKAGADSLYPLEGLSFEDMRKIKGLGMVILASPYLKSLPQKEQDYLEPSEAEYAILDCSDSAFTNTYWTVRYNSLLKEGHSETDTAVMWAKDAMLVTSDTGLQVGTVERILAGKAVIRFSKPVALRDTLRIGETEFQVSAIDEDRSFVSQGSVATVNFPTDPKGKKPVFGTAVTCTQRHNLGPDRLNEDIKPYKKPLDLNIIIEDNAFIANGMRTDIDLQEAKSTMDLTESIRKTFAASDRSLFTLGSLKVENRSNLKCPFLPMSVLKQIRRAFYEAQDRLFKEE